MRKYRSYMDNQSPQISHDAFEELVVQYHHRLLSLEADLKDRAKNGLISPALLSKRVRRLKAVHKELNALQRLYIAEKPGKLTTTDIGLPVLEDCSPEERAIVQHFLEDRELDVVALEHEASKVYGWLQDAIAGRVGALRATLRLSKLRGFISCHEKRATALTEESKSLTIHVDKLLIQASGSGGREAGKTTLEGLMSIFHQLETTISRVAKLKASVKREEAKTKEMEDWIITHEQRFTNLRPAMPAPTPLATVQAAQALSSSIGRNIERVSKRRDLVVKFWEDILDIRSETGRVGASANQERCP